MLEMNKSLNVIKNEVNEGYHMNNIGQAVGNNVLGLSNRGVESYENERHALDLSLLTQDALVAKTEVSEEELDRRLAKIYTKQASRYFKVSMLVGTHPLKQRKAYVVKIECLVGEQEPYYVFLTDLLSDKGDIKEEIISNLKEMASLNKMDYKRIRECASFLRDNNLGTYVGSLVSYIENTVGNEKAREDYLKLTKFILTNRHRIASRVKNNYNPEEHIGTLLDDKANITKYGQPVIALKSSAVALDIFGQKEIEDKRTESVISTQLFNAIKLGLRDLGVLVWHGTDGRKKTTVGKNRLEQCLIFKVDNLL
jgi:hypothetical protein